MGWHWLFFQFSYCETLTSQPPVPQLPEVPWAFTSSPSLLIFIMCHQSPARPPPTDSLWRHMSPPSTLQQSKASFSPCTSNCCITLPFFIEGTNNLGTTGVVSSTDSTLVILQLWANDAITASPHTLPPDTDGITVRPTFGSIGHLNMRNPSVVGSNRAQALNFLVKKSKF